MVPAFRLWYAHGRQSITQTRASKCQIAGGFTGSRELHTFGRLSGRLSTSKCEKIFRCQHLKTAVYRISGLFWQVGVLLGDFCSLAYWQSLLPDITYAAHSELQAVGQLQLERAMDL